MSKSSRCLAALALSFCLSIAASSQITISGNVRSSVTKEAVPSVSVTVKGTTTGTFTDEKGNFKVTTSHALPLTLMFTSIGFESQEVNVSDAAASVQVDFLPASSLGTEVVISASRIPERILESPVSIERVNLTAIRNAPAANYYDLLKNIKGVDLTYSSLTYCTPSTRGFNASGNARLNQLVDGMDNQAPGLNFSVGSVVGLTELDVESMELLPGASSALYGPGGMNGTLLINSKDPFRYQGVSFQVKQGVMHLGNKQRDNATPYYDWSLRWAYKISDKFAFKIGGQFIQAKDWIALDTSNYLAGDAALSQYGSVKAGTRTTDPNYNGVNVYGDETSVDIRPFIQGAIAGNPALGPLLNPYLTSPQFVSRTGYREDQVVDNTTMNVRVQGGLYYMITPDIEASLSGYWGTGNTVYTGSDRYSLKNLKMGQYKLELKHANWFLRGYTTQENAGESYNATVTTQLFNEAWKPSYNPADAANSWYPQYTSRFIQRKVAGMSDADAHMAARDFADVNRPQAGTTQFNQLFDQVRSKPIPQGGLFLDRSDMYMVEGQYNFSNKIKVVDLLVGANWKQYVLKSKGTLFFADTNGRKINEIGAYAQVGKSLLNDKLKLSASGRFDYNENFDPRFTPRFTAVYKVLPDHNLRASYQTAYRFPTTQNQWINLTIGGGTILIGGLPELRDFYNFNNNQPYTLESVRQGNPAVLEKAVFAKYKPETMRSVEFGYKGLFNKKILVDVYGYFGKYENFLGRRIVVQPNDPNQPAQVYNASTRTTYSVAVNSSSKVTTYGFGASVDLLLPRNFVASVNATTDRISDVPSGFVAFFNVPSYRLNLGLSNSGFGHNNRFGFNINLRNQDDFFYESDFRQGTVDGFTSIDALVSYKFPKQHVLVKIGGTNITNTYYKTGFGNPEMGGLYYISVGYNVF